MRHARYRSAASSSGPACAGPDTTATRPTPKTAVHNAAALRIGVVTPTRRRIPKAPPEKAVDSASALGRLLQYSSRITHSHSGLVTSACALRLPRKTRAPLFGSRYSVSVDMDVPLRKLGKIGVAT